MAFAVIKANRTPKLQVLSGPVTDRLSEESGSRCVGLVVSRGAQLWCPLAPAARSWTILLY